MTRQTLLGQLNESARKVNAMIDKIVSVEREPELLYRASKHLINAGGKRLRPFLVLKSCEIVGGSNEASLPMAAAVELLHSFTLIHDDIMDEDAKRRGVPTVHVLWGVPTAIIAGDMLFARVYDSVISYTDPKRASPERVLRALSVITEATIAICEGQALDMMFERMESVSEEDYFKMIGRKTAALFKAAAQAGAIVGGGTVSQTERLGNFAYNAGLAFQIVDDILGLTADEKVLGKPVGSDIREGKRTLIMAHALGHADEERRRLILSTLGNRKAASDQIRGVTQIVRSCGSIEYAAKKAEGIIEKARRQLSPFPDSLAKRMLLDLSDFLVARKY